MSRAEIFNFREVDLIGTVCAVDSSKVTITVSNSQIVSELTLGNLIGIKGFTEFELLIGLVDRVVRGLTESVRPILLEDDENSSIAVPGDTVRVSLIGTFRSVDGKRNNVFKRGADSYPHIDREAFLISGQNLQNFMDLLGADLAEQEKLRIGTFVADRSAVAIASGDRFFQRHAAILGSTGSGKSCAVALLIERASRLPYPNIVVFDMHGEYATLSEGDARIAAAYKIAGPKDITAASDKSLFLPYWLLNRDEMLSMLLDRTDSNAPNQASRFSTHVLDLKREWLINARDAGREAAGSALSTFTVDSPIPFSLSQLIERLSDDNTRKGERADGKGTKSGEWEGKLSRFLARLEAKIHDRRYGFMFQPPETTLAYEWMSAFATSMLGAKAEQHSGIKIIDFSEVPSDVLPIVTGVLVRTLYDVQFWTEPSERRPISIFCDEAHLHLPTREDADAVERQALANFERVAKEGRKYGFGLVVISQRPSDVSRTILSQCNNFMTLRLTNDVDQSVIRKLVPDNLSQLVDYLPMLDVGEALILGDAMLLPTRVKLDLPTILPASATRNFWRDWASVPPDGQVLARAVDSMRAQGRS